MRNSLFVLLWAMVGCTNIDCPLDNVVEMTCGLYKAEDESSFTLNTEMSVLSSNSQHVLLNNAKDISVFSLPVRHGVGKDTLLFCFSHVDGRSAVDTLFLRYTDHPHFESVDCPAALFHTLLEVQWTSHALSVFPLTLDSVEIVRPIVNYDNVENIKIYLRSTVN